MKTTIELQNGFTAELAVSGDYYKLTYKGETLFLNEELKKKYEVEIHFVNGDKVQARVDARNRKDALRRIKETEQYQDFARQCGDIVAEYSEPIPIEPISNEDFVVTAILNKPGWHMVANMKKGIRVEFKDGMYNETQRIVRFGGEELSALDEATALREIGDFMYANFRRLI